MSHSRKVPKRAWDAGMRDEDLVSIVVFEQDRTSSISPKQVSPVHFISVRDMRSAYASGQVSITEPKGFEEGSEIRVKWDCAATDQRSVVQAVESGRIKLTLIPEARRKYIQLSRGKGTRTLLPQVQSGETVEANQIVAAVVPVRTKIQRPPSS